MLKKAQVIMLPTENESRFHLFTGNKPGLYSYPEIVSAIPKNPYCVNQHLYIVSDDEIKEGDWYLDNIPKYYVIEQANEDWCLTKDHKKIIATTDTSLIESIEMIGTGSTYLFKLPQPSQQFIEKYIESYNKGEVITNVLVEYETLKTTANNKHFGEGHIYSIANKLKINPKDNTITIKKLKDNWNREEVLTLIRKAITDTNKVGFRNISMDYNKWIEENL